MIPVRIYQYFSKVLETKSWFKGLALWYWEVNPDIGDPKLDPIPGKSYAPRGKPAARIIFDHNSKYPHPYHLEIEENIHHI